jgi:drug/metabolite transporter (DMT)-like permease
MIFLFLSIVFSSYLTLSFKVLQRYGINTFQAIVFNYITCVCTGALLNGAFPINATNMQAPWFKWALIMGVMFISIFNVVAFTTQKMGVAVASVANKLSLVIPFIFSIYLYSETATALKIAGIVIALLAVILTCYPAKNNTNKAQQQNTGLLLLLPTSLFISSGLLDTLIVYVQNIFFTSTASNFNNFLITAFASAGIIGILILFAQIVSSKQQFDYRALIAGIIIGIPNYFSIWCLGKVIAAHQGNSSAIMPVNNMGIVLFSTLAAWIIFKEELTGINWLGIVLAIGAIALIAYG